jgi:hypothetical protein
MSRNLIDCLRLEVCVSVTKKTASRTTWRCVVPSASSYCHPSCLFCSKENNGSTEILAHSYQTTRRHIPEDYHLHFDKLRSHPRKASISSVRVYGTIREWLNVYFLKSDAQYVRSMLQPQHSGGPRSSEMLCCVGWLLVTDVRLQWEGMTSPTDSQGVALLSGSLDLSLCWGFLGRT